MNSLPFWKTNKHPITGFDTSQHNKKAIDSYYKKKREKRWGEIIKKKN
jgi:hypothetical protein